MPGRRPAPLQTRQAFHPKQSSPTLRREQPPHRMRHAMTGPGAAARPSRLRGAPRRRASSPNRPRPAAPRIAARSNHLLPVAWRHPRAAIDGTPRTTQNGTRTRVTTITSTLGTPTQPWAPTGIRAAEGPTETRAPRRRHRKIRLRRICRAKRAKPNRRRPNHHRPNHHRPNRHRPNRRRGLPCRVLLPTSRRPSRLRSPLPVHRSRRPRHRRPRRQHHPQQRHRHRLPLHRDPRLGATRATQRGAFGICAVASRAGLTLRLRPCQGESRPWR